jgi:hypothetical protein
VACVVQSGRAMAVAKKSAVLLVTAMFVAACQLDEGQRDRQIIDVHAERQGDGVLVHVFVKNLGTGTHCDDRSSRHCNEYCVKGTWAREGSIVALQEGCNDEELRPDHVGVVKIFAPAVPVPSDGRVVMRFGMKKEDAADYFQDESDGEWTLLSP